MIKGLISTQPAHSCKVIRDSGDSKGDGEYWIDPEKNGKPVKVFCDMTTDGGKLKDFGEPQEVWKFDEDCAQGAEESYLTVFPVIFTVELLRESICC